MTATRIFVTSVVLVVAVIGLNGCGDDDPVASNGVQLPAIASVSPPDGAVAVATSTAITIQFATPMDPQSVVVNFHCLGGDEMHEWMDGLTNRHGPGPGHMMDMDQMMEWMHRIEMPGEYRWNDAHDFCEFVPENGLMPDTDYMVFMYDGMRSHHGEPMGMRHLQHDGYMYHFSTAP